MWDPFRFHWRKAITAHITAAGYLAFAYFLFYYTPHPRLSMLTVAHSAD